MIFKTKPWNHQQKAFDFCFNKPGAGIFMDMGTGKSKVTIDLVVNRGNQQILLVCPKRVIEVWPREFDIHSDGIHVVPLTNSTIKNRAAEIQGYKGPYPVVFVTNYDVVWQEPLKTSILNRKFDCVIADESHRIKKPGGKASRLFHRLGKVVPYKLALTGTPMAHTPLDVYGQYRFLDQNIFGTNYSKFESEYATKGGYQFRQITGYINQERLHEKMYSIAYRVMAKDVLDLPKSIDLEFEVELPPSVMQIYKYLDKESVLNTEHGPMAVNNPLTQNMRLHQLTSGLNQDGLGNITRIDNSKATMFADILEDLPIREPIVVFARFTGDLDIIHEMCSKSGRIYAEVSGREDNLKAWKAGLADVVGVQIQSGSEGEDYTRAKYAIYYSHGLSLKDYNQSRARIDRPGQTRNPVFIHIIAKNTVDKKILAALKANKEVIDYILDTMRYERRT